jgi:hypothetical protein
MSIADDPPLEFIFWLRSPLNDLLLQVGYRGRARYVAWWWEPCGDELAWMDDHGSAAVGLADNWRWLLEVRPWLEAMQVDCGSADGQGQHVLVHDRRDNRLFSAPRQAGLRWIEARASARRTSSQG